MPFGETLSDPTSAGKFAKGYTNHEQTDPSGLIYMQARFYLPMYGRFASPDPALDQHFEDTQSWNIYSYVQNDPTMRIDPTGMVVEPLEPLAADRKRHQQHHAPHPKREKSSLPAAEKPKDVRAARAAYGETNGLKPQKGKDGKVDPKSKQELTDARAAVADVGRRNNHIHRTDGSKKKDADSREAWNDSARASAQDAHLPSDVRHFFLRQDGEGTQKPDWAGDKTPFKSFGPFVNPGGGDVPKGNKTYIDFYQGVK